MSIAVIINGFNPSIPQRGSPLKLKFHFLLPASQVLDTRQELCCSNGSFGSYPEQTEGSPDNRIVGGKFGFSSPNVVSKIISQADPSSAL